MIRHLILLKQNQHEQLKSLEVSSLKILIFSVRGWWIKIRKLYSEIHSYANSPKTYHSPFTSQNIFYCHFQLTYATILNISPYEKVKRRYRLYRYICSKLFLLINIVELSPNDSIFWALKIFNCAGGEKWHIGRLYNDIFYASLWQKSPILIQNLWVISARPNIYLLNQWKSRSNTITF